MIGIVYTCDDFSGEFCLQLEEVSELQWFTLNELPSNIHPPNKRLLDDFVRCIGVE